MLTRPALNELEWRSPSLQRFAVIQLFEKLRSSPPYLGLESDPGREVITRCLHSSSTAVVDQSVRELCRLVKDSLVDISRGLLELQSAVEGSESRSVEVLVKGIGFIVRVGFQRNCFGSKTEATESHPFVKVLSCGLKVHNVLVQQVLYFVLQCRQYGMAKVCEFLRPVLNFSILRLPFSDSSSFSFARLVILSLASLCCSLPAEAVPIFDLLIGCLRYYQCCTAEDFLNFIGLAEFIVDAHVFVLRYLAKDGLMVHEAQLSGVKMLEAVLSPYLDFGKQSVGIEPVVEMSRRLLDVQKELGLLCVPELSAPMSSLFVIFSTLELEHEQLCMLKLISVFLNWKIEDEYSGDGVSSHLIEVLLFNLPIINLISSPSKSVKRAATDLLLLLEKVSVNYSTLPIREVSAREGFLFVSKPGTVIVRLLQHLWLQDLPSTSFFLNISSINGSEGKQMEDGSKYWISQLGKYAAWVVERRKSSTPVFHYQQMKLEMPLLLSALVAVLLLHYSLGSSATEAFTALGIMEPKLGVTLLLSILYYNNLLRTKNLICPDMLLKLLGMVPFLATHTPMVPLVVKMITPMLFSDAKPVLYATGIRLLCKTWEISDRIFGSLQGVLRPERFSEVISERTVGVSMAASLQDICRRNPDRGVELILSVSLMQTFKVGAMDAEAYPEAARNILEILWEVGSSSPTNVAMLWTKARVYAFESLKHFEVSLIENIQNFKERFLELLLHETNLDVLRSMEELETKIIKHEHSTRRRLIVEKRVSGNKIEKLLHVFPRIVLSSDKISNARELPGAALLCLSLGAEDVNYQNAHDVHGQYVNAMNEIAASLHLSRNIVIALLSQQSWKPFMQRWMRDYIRFLDVKAPSTIMDKTSKAANDILKKMIQLGEDSIPRSAENIALAVGALCAALPPSAHAIKATASKFLLNWLFQYEHEHRQWSAAISLGLVSSVLHVTDRKQKIQNINGLIKVAHDSRNVLIKGACAVGLGFSSQDLLIHILPVEYTSDEENFNLLEVDLLGKIVRTLAVMICQLDQSSSNILRSLSQYAPPGAENVEVEIASESMCMNCDEQDEDIWGIAGLILGLGSCISALYRAGSQDAVCNLKSLLISWIRHARSLVQNSGSCCNDSHSLITPGACIALPTVVSFCQQVELVPDNELDELVACYEDIISGLLSVKASGTFHQSLLMASCIGAGDLLASILNRGVHSIEVQQVKKMLELLRITYSNPYPHIIHFGGMFGVVNAMGAGAGNMFHQYSLTTSFQTIYERKESSRIMCPLLESSAFVPLLVSLIQDMFLGAQNSDNHQLRHYAAWAVSFLRHHFWSRDGHNYTNSHKNDSVSCKPVSQKFPEDSSIMQLSLWLMHFDYSQAPALPGFDWGAVIRRTMRYEDQIAKLLPPDSVYEKGTLCEECILFSLAHANKFEQLLSLVDELTDLSRFRVLDLNLQCCVLHHLSDLIRIFASSRLEKLFNDISVYFASPISAYQTYNLCRKSSLRISCWKGICQCLGDDSLSTSSEYISSMEKCMEVLFSLLPEYRTVAMSGQNKVLCTEEWNEATRCLAKARRGLLSDLLQVSEIDLIQRDDYFSVIAKKILVRAWLVRLGSLPLTELGKLKNVYILNTGSHDLWDVHVGVVTALQLADGGVQRQWLIDVLEISCITKYPSTALRFLGLLSGSCCRYMPFLILDPKTVLSDLPLTLSSLLSTPNWSTVAETAVSYLWASTERVHEWATSLASGSEAPSLQLQPIDQSENEMADFLLLVMHSACVSLKEYLPLDKKLKLANMAVR